MSEKSQSARTAPTSFSGGGGGNGGGGGGDHGTDSDRLRGAARWLSTDRGGRTSRKRGRNRHFDPIFGCVIVCTLLAVYLF